MEFMKSCSCSLCCDRILWPKWAFVYFAKTFQQNAIVLKLSSKMLMF